MLCARSAFFAAAMASADGRFVERGRRRVQLGIVEDGWDGGNRGMWTFVDNPQVRTVCFLLGRFKFGVSTSLVDRR